MMISPNDYLKTSEMRIKQLKNQKKSQEKRMLEARRKIDNRRFFIIGELICKYFPEMMKYQPQRNKVRTESEFAVFENILYLLAADKDLLPGLKEIAVKMTSEC